MVGWYGMLFAAIWAGGDMVTEYNGQTAVAEQNWMDWDYYAYHGPLVRGEDALGHSSRVPAPREPERDAGAWKTGGDTPGPDIPKGGEVQHSDMTKSAKVERSCRQYHTLPIRTHRF